MQMYWVLLTGYLGLVWLNLFLYEFAINTSGGENSGEDTGDLAKMRDQVKLVAQAAHFK